jgi:hypothetical protein
MCAVHIISQGPETTHSHGWRVNQIITGNVDHTDTLKIRITHTNTIATDTDTRSDISRQYIMR